MLADETIAVVAEATPAFCADANQVWTLCITDSAIGVLGHLLLQFHSTIDFKSVEDAVTIGTLQGHDIAS